MKDDKSDQVQMLVPTPVQVSNIPDSAALNERLLKVIYDVKATTPNTKPDSWSCDVYTTIGTPLTLLEHPEFTEFLDIALDRVVRFARAFKFDVDRYKPRINECWVNVYNNNHSQDVHLHPNSVFSGIYYAKAPEGSSPTLFYSPMADVMLVPPSTARSPLTDIVAGMAAVEGRMLLFRSCVRHSVLPNRIDEDRITIAFNATM